MSRAPGAERPDWPAHSRDSLADEPQAPPVSDGVAAEVTGGRTVGPGGQSSLREKMSESFHSMKLSGKLFIAGCVIGFVVFTSLKLDDHGVAGILASWRAMGACGSIHCAANALAQGIWILELPLSLLIVAVTFTAIQLKRDTLACVFGILLFPSLGQLMLMDKWRWPAAIACGAIRVWLTRDIQFGEGKWVYFGAFSMCLMLARILLKRKTVAPTPPDAGGQAGERA